MRITTFASGSGGNCALVEAGGIRLLLDAGISMKRIICSLSAAGAGPEDISGVLITHEHSDHVSGLPMLIKHHAIPVFAPRTVAARLTGMFPGIEGSLGVIHTGEAFSFGNAEISAFHTMHDTPESVGYRIDAEGSLGFCTDLGAVTEEVRSALAGVDTAVVEFNHDEEKLRYGGYPVYLKRRILSDHGHLSNESGGELAAFLAENGARRIILGHLSRENNSPALALAAAEKALGGEAAEIFVAPPDRTLAVEVEAGCWA